MYIFFAALSFFTIWPVAAEQKLLEPKLVLVTVATDETDGLKRLRQSAAEFGHQLLVFGMGQQWKGGDMTHGTGGAQKVRILRENLDQYNFKDKENTMIMFVDAYDVVINADSRTIVDRFFYEFDNLRVLFSAEPFCWPDRTLAPEYPLVTFGERFLNSGMFMGFVDDVMEMLMKYGSQLQDNDDDQLFYTKLYLNKAIRSGLKIGLDSLSRIFQNLNGMSEHVSMDFDEDGNARVLNKLYNTHPLILHGNGPSKLQLNHFGNYIAHGFNSEEGCLRCAKKDIEYDKVVRTMGLAIFVAKPIPYVEEFLKRIQQFHYPKDRIHLLFYNNQAYNKEIIKTFFESAAVAGYASVKTILNGLWKKNEKEVVNEHFARDSALNWAAETGVDYLIILDADVHLTNLQCLNHLVRTMQAQDIGILAPMVVQTGKLFSNFWGAVSDTGYYARSHDYIELVEKQRTGLWNVPFLNSAFCISRKKLKDLLQHKQKPFSYNMAIDSDMSFAQFCRDKGHFMLVDNQLEYGFLVNSDSFADLPQDSLIHLELYDYPNNRQLWEQRYIHPEYFDTIKPDRVVPLACPDVYDFPFVSKRFCAEIIEVVENFGQWSDGSNHDRRLEGGYENVPTRDIHMNQVHFDRQWLAVIDDYVAPMQEKVFTGYYQRPAKSNMMFVVRYRPDEQASLRPHHDASTYSIDIALNKRDVDYEGGGVRYIRYNCTVPADQVGWSMLFPGRLTHLHEGLPTTKGTRYILVSFINP